MSSTGRSALPARGSSRPRAVLRTLIDALRGALIGVTEIIPGVSGGTIALIIGVYDTLIDGAGHLARAAARAVTDGLRGMGLSRAAEHVRSVRWAVVLPVGLGMLTAIFIAARLLSPVIENNPVETRALFAGLIAMSLLVPIRMSGARWNWLDVVIAVAAAAVVFVAIGLPSSAPSASPPLPLVAGAAALAVCALVLPGVSGSYLLLALGLYAPTLAALNDLNIAFIATFMLGGVIGLASFVPVLQWLLAHRRRITLVVMTGMMAGSLRAVWPWQSADNALLPPAENWPAMLGLFVIGAAIVIALLVTEAALLRRRLMSEPTIAETLPSDESGAEPGGTAPRTAQTRG